MDELMRNTISDYIGSTILKQPGRKIDPDEPLLSSGLIDSFNLVDFAIFLEKEFNVRIDDTELFPQVFDNINQLIQLIHTK